MQRMILTDQPQPVLARRLEQRRVKSDTLSPCLRRPAGDCSAAPVSPPPAAAMAPVSVSGIRKTRFSATDRNPPVSSATAARAGGMGIRTIQDCGGGND